jgi:hypothetical protein
MAQNRRSFLLALVAGTVALAVVVAPVLADELLGVLTKVDVDGKSITVKSDDTDKEVKVKITDDTQQTKKGGELVKVDLEKLSAKFEKAKENGKSIRVKVTHEKGTASKLEFQKKKAQ